jgi:hypothetical protein
MAARQLPWEYKATAGDYQSVSGGAFAEARSWDFMTVFEKQRAYLKRFKAKDKGASSQFSLGCDPAYY